MSGSEAIEQIEFLSCALKALRIRGNTPALPTKAVRSARATSTSPR
jgi:hypothetical protein